MECKKCQSENLRIIASGPHKKLVCNDCLAFQKFLLKSEAKTFVESDRANMADLGNIEDLLDENPDENLSRW